MLEAKELTHPGYEIKSQIERRVKAENREATPEELDILNKVFRYASRVHGQAWSKILDGRGSR